MKLGHASVPEWWEETFKSIALKLPTGKVPLHNISRLVQKVHADDDGMELHSSID